MTFIDEHDTDHGRRMRFLPVQTDHTAAGLDKAAREGH
jgi:hypothetical protein